MKSAIILVFATVAAACAGGAGASTETVTPSVDRSVLSGEELRTAQGPTLYDVIRALRPEWLRRNPSILQPGAEGDIVVYMDRARMGGPSTLRQLRPSAVASVRYYSPSEAAGEYGPGHIHGAIAVTTRP